MRRYRGLSFTNHHSTNDCMRFERRKWRAAHFLFQVFIFSRQSADGGAYLCTIQSCNRHAAHVRCTCFCTRFPPTCGISGSFRRIFASHGCVIYHPPLRRWEHSTNDGFVRRRRLLDRISGLLAAEKRARAGSRH
jgi:hypothetical protein